METAFVKATNPKMLLYAAAAFAGGVVVILLGAGGITLAIILNYHQISPSPLSVAVVTAVLSALFINELIAPTLLRDMLVRSGEVQK